MHTCAGGRRPLVPADPGLPHTPDGMSRLFAGDCSWCMAGMGRVGGVHSSLPARASGCGSGRCLLGGGGVWCTTGTQGAPSSSVHPPCCAGPLVGGAKALWHGPPDPPATFRCAGMPLLPAADSCGLKHCVGVVRHFGYLSTCPSGDRQRICSYLSLFSIVHFFVCVYSLYLQSGISLNACNRL